MRIALAGRVALVFAALGCAQRTGQPSGLPDAGAAGADGAGARDAVAASARDAGECQAELVSPFGANSVLVCERCAPHGDCPLSDVMHGECRCRPRYEGARCDECAAGYVEHDGACVTPCEAAGMPCFGICTGTEAAPVCECAIGHEGPQCQACSAGFEPDFRVTDVTRCVPTCDGACAAEELCTAPARDEQRCDCMVGYVRDGSGACRWQGLIADARFEHGCAHWRLFRQVANAGDGVLAAFAPEGLVLQVDQRCSVAGATADAHLPAAHTLPDAALAITASGVAGADLHVAFGSSGPAPLFGLGQPLAGTGAAARYVVCLPVEEGARQTSITLAVGEPGNCSERLDAAFTVHALEAVSDDRCAD